MLSHRNLTAATVSIIAQTGDSGVKQEDVHMSYLPATHIFERLMQLMLMCVGGSIGFWQGDVKKLVMDMMALRPTVFPAVPRILNRIYDNVQAQVAVSKLKSALFNYALKSKFSNISFSTATQSNCQFHSAIWRQSWWDFLCAQIQNMLGGRVRMIACGAAPIKPEILQFYRAALGASVFEVSKCRQLEEQIRSCKQEFHCSLLIFIHK